MTKFFDEDEAPSEEQQMYAQELKVKVDEIVQLPQGSGKTWLLNRLLRYVRRVDPHTEELVD